MTVVGPSTPDFVCIQALGGGKFSEQVQDQFLFIITLSLTFNPLNVLVSFFYNSDGRVS